MNIIAVVLTCDRIDLTKETVDSFRKYNDIPMYYGDDASINPQIHRFMKKRGVECILRNTKRIGCSPATEKLLNAATGFGDYIILLQNDFETIRSIDLEVVEEIFENSRVGWIRLFGEQKNDVVKGCPTSTEHRHRKGSPKIEWVNCDIKDEKLEIADAPWTYNPVIVRSSLVADVMKGAKRELDSIKNADKLSMLSVRFFNNITNHIGIQQSTPGGVFGKPGGSFHKPSKKL